MILSQNDRMFVGCIPSENNEPVVVLRASDPATHDMLLAYLNAILAEEESPEFAHDILDLIVRFKHWQFDPKPLTGEGRAEAELADSIKATLEQKGGFCRRSELLNKYRIPSFQLDQVLSQLDVHRFRIATPGRPANYYVLPEAVEKFRQRAVQEDWTVLTTDTNHPSYS